MIQRNRRRRSQAAREPLRDASNRANISPGNPAQSPRSSPPCVQKQQVSKSSSDSYDDGSSSPTMLAENKRISAVVESEPDSKRNSAVSTTSTASGKSKRKTHIGPWQLGKTLGKGSTGRVRLAKHAGTGQVAAIKIVSKKYAAMVQSQSIAAMDQNREPATRTRGAKKIPSGIEREVVIMKLIEHPNVISLYDVWENRGELYLVLEYVEGGELFDYVSHMGALPEVEAIRLFRQIISGLSYCHKFNICHRDLKPENILLDKDGNIKLADFGMAALQPAGHWLNTSCGSPHYAAPEIINGLKYRGDKADIWSCGIILYALLAGCLPFDGGDLPTTLQLVKAGQYAIPNFVSDEAADLLQRILQKKPSNRISIDDMFQHPVLKKYERLHLTRFPGSGPMGVPCSLTLKAWCRIVSRRQDIDMDLLRSLQTLWHGVKLDELVSRLLSDEINHEKLFYKALIKFRDDQLEHYEGPLEYSNSDYHHIAQRSHLNPPSRQFNGRLRSRSWRGSQLSIVTDRSHSKPLRNEPQSTRTFSTYDPYRSSRTPIANPHVEYANVIVHHHSSDDSSGDDSNDVNLVNHLDDDAQLRAFNQTQMRKQPSLFASSLNGTRWQTSKANSLASFRTQSSMASYCRRRQITVPHSRSYKRNVSFRHSRNRSGGSNARRSRVSQSRSHYSLSKGVQSHRRPQAGDALLTSEPFSSPDLPTPPQSVRPRRQQKTTDELEIAKHRVSYQVWREEARKMSAEFGKICEEAFNRTSVSPSDPTSDDTVDFTDRKGSESPPTSVSVSADVGILGDKCGTAALQTLEPISSSLDATRALVEKRKRLIENASTTTTEDIVGHLSEVIAHLDRLIAGESTPSSTVKNQVVFDTSSTGLLEAGYLPAISEEHAVVTVEESESTPEALPQALPQLDDKKRSSIRVVPHDSMISIRSGPRTVKHHKSNDSLGRFRLPSALSGEDYQTPVNNRRASSRYYTGLEPIEENPGSPRRPDKSSGDTKRWGWLRHKSQHSDLRPPTPPAKDDVPLRPVSVPCKSTLDQVVPANGNITAKKGSLNDQPTEKKKGFFRFFGRKKADKTDTFELGNDDAASSVWSFALSEKAKNPKCSASTQAKDDASYPKNGNWLARFFAIKPASKILALSVSEKDARREVVKILKGWKAYGMDNVRLDRKASIVRGRVGENNSLNLPPVEFYGQFFPVNLNCKPANLSILYLKQERGAASTFLTLAKRLRKELKAKALLVRNRSMAKQMTSMLDDVY